MLGAQERSAAAERQDSAEAVQQALNDAQVNHNYSKALCPSCNTTAQADLIASLAVKAGVDSNCGSFMTSHMPGAQPYPPLARLAAG